MQIELAAAQHTLTTITVKYRLLYAGRNCLPDKPNFIARGVTAIAGNNPPKEAANRYHCPNRDLNASPEKKKNSKKCDPQKTQTDFNQVTDEPLFGRSSRHGEVTQNTNHL
jgi:hypothetical protein